MIAAGLQALLSHWRRNPWQLFTMIAGLAMATALWSGVQAINAEARASYDRAASIIGQGQFAQIVRKDSAPLSLSQYVSLRRAGWLVSPVLEGELDLNGRRFRMTGIDLLTLPRSASGPAGLNLSDLAQFLSPEGLIVAHPDDAEALAKLGLDVRTEPGQTPGRIEADIAVAQKLLETDGITRLLVLPQQPLGQPELTSLDPTLTLRENRGNGDVARLTESFHLNLTAFGFLSFAVGIFIVYGAIGLAFEQRRPVFRTLRTLGLPLGILMAMLALELTLFALTAGAIGVALGYLFAGALLPDVAATLRGLYGAEVSGNLALRPAWWLSGLAMALGGTAAAAAGAFWRLNRLPLLASTQPRAWAVDAERTSRRMAVIAGALGLVGLLTALLGSGLLAGFALLACLLIAAALALPFLLDLMLRLGAGFARRAVPQWFWADTRQQLPGLSMALMALLLAMAANIGVSTMVSSFRLTFTGWLDQRLTSELYMNARSPEEAAALTGYLQDKVDAILPIISVETRIGGLPAEIYGVRNHSTYRKNWKLLQAVPDVWDRLAASEGALVNEQLFRREGLTVGQKLDTDTGDSVLGVYGDYGNPAGQVVLGIDLFRARYPDAVALRFGLRTGTADPEAVAADLRQRFDLPEDALVDQARIKAVSLQIFERTFSVTAALNVLTLSVAGFAILISLLTLATMRLPQLAPVWALGLTRRRLAMLELVRALCLAAFTGMAAIPLGLGLAWVLLAIVNVQAFGWRLPMFLFPMDYLQLGALTLLAAFLAALWPALRLARTPPDALLKVFSNER
ncbi:MAG: FtsX-like permease family protein [Paracoccaceae bacterium]